MKWHRNMITDLWYLVRGIPRMKLLFQRKVFGRLIESEIYTSHIIHHMLIEATNHY